jgi:uncharacterized protein YicC (UPF0701 family)
VVVTNIRKTIERAYAKAMFNRVKIPRQLSSKERNWKKHIQDDFRRGLIDYYKAEETKEGQKFCYCVVTERWRMPG